MRNRSLFLVVLLTFALSAIAYADSIKIPLPPIPPPPPVPKFESPPEPPAPPAPRMEFVVPAPPSFIRFDVSYPDVWFYDDHRDEWFYYEKHHKPHYVRHHEWRDDGRHYYGNAKSWRKSDRSYASKKGWYKHGEKGHRKAKKKWWRFWGD